MGWIITFACFFLLAILPLGASVLYDENGICVRIIAGPCKITVFPLPKWLKKSSKPKPKEKKTDSKNSNQPAKEKTEKEKQTKGGSWKDFIPFVKLAVDFLGDFRRKLRLNHLEMKLILAGSDPCDVAVNYGRAWAALANLLPRLERVFVIGKRDLEVECDFTSSETLVTARLDISITLGRLIALVVVYGIRGLKVFLQFKKKRKGGAVK